MKNLKTPEQVAQENKDGKQLLTAIKEMIKTPVLRKEGFEKLLEIDSDLLSVENQVYYYYIKGRYHLLEFKNSTDKEDLELLYRADDCYNDMVTIAYQNDMNIPDPKFHFARAYAKYLIALNHSSDEVKKKLIHKAKQIIGRVLCYQPKNPSCLWLQKQLQEV